MAYIELRRIRDFNQTLNAATEYLRQNFVVLSKTTLLIVMPLLVLGLVSSNIGVYYLGTAFTGLSDNSSDTLAFSLVWSMMLVFFFLAIGIIVNIAVLYEHMRLYSMTETPEQITMRDVLQQMRRKAGVYVKTTVGIYFLLTFAYIIFAIGVGLFVGLLGITGGALFIGIGLLLSLLGGVYIFAAISMLYIVRTVEGLRFGSAIRRCFNLAQQKFWTTFCLYLVTYLIIYSVTAVPTWLGMGFVGGFSLLSVSTSAWLLTALLTIAEIIYVSVYLVVNSLGMLVVAFRYFSLVEEREGIGLLRKIDFIGVANEY